MILPIFLYRFLSVVRALIAFSVHKLRSGKGGADIILYRPEKSLVMTALPSFTFFDRHREVPVDLVEGIPHPSQSTQLVSTRSRPVRWMNPLLLGPFDLIWYHSAVPKTSCPFFAFATIRSAVRFL
jgi:hypothetical protein